MSHSQQVIDNSKGNNIVVGPDYGQLSRYQTNVAILEAFIPMLFSTKKNNFSIKTVIIMLRNIVALMVIKTLLEDSKGYLDTFRFTDITLFKYYYQRMIYFKVGESKTEIIKVGDKWFLNGSTTGISINSLSPYLERKKILVSSPGNYYYMIMGHIIVKVYSKYTIFFCSPHLISSSTIPL